MTKISFAMSKIFDLLSPRQGSRSDSLQPRPKARWLFQIAPLLLGLVLSSSSHAQLDSRSSAGLSSITERSLRATLTFLASDELEGRETTYRGQKLAALYISSYFQQLGLKPIGDSGTYLQHFNVEVTRPGKNLSIAVKRASGETETYDKLTTQFLVFPRGLKSSSVSGSLAFVGYGISSPDTEYNYNDYENIDVKGKIVLMMGYEPQEKDSMSIFNGIQQTKFSFSGGRGLQLKERIAHEHGAAGILYMPEVGDHPTVAALARFLGDFLSKGTMALPDSGSQQSPSLPVFIITKAVANELLQPSGKTIDELHAKIDEKLKPASFDVPGTAVTLNLDLKKELVQTENAVGFLEGSDPVLKKEVLVFTAHYDHLGIGSDGAIYHGADDDGSGTTAVLEIAKAFAANPERPKRSILFMTVTGEEKGLLGSLYYTNHPIIPLEETVADLNTDMIGRVDPNHEGSPDSSHYVYVIGADKLSPELRATLERANRETVNFNLDYKYDDPNDPEQFYRRSDHFNFARKGIPIAFFFSGVHKDYHRPTDTVEKINFDKMANTIRLIYMTGWDVANAPHRPIISGNAEMYR
ncbi:MAG: M28 family peptidase [Bacteroidota bacterium]